MTKAGQKAYLAVLKRAAKSKSGTKGSVFLIGDECSALFDQNTSISLTIEGVSATAGEYDAMALECIATGKSIDLYRKGEYISVFDGVPNWDHQIDIDENLSNSLVLASQFTSTDSSRPGLQQVVIEGGWLMATDGYRAFAQKCDIPELQGVRFSPALMDCFTRLRKYNRWCICVGTGRNGSKWVAFESGYVSINSCQNENPFPDLMKIMSITEPYNTLLTIPVAEVIHFADPRHQSIVIEETGEISLTEPVSGDKIPTPLSATIEHITPIVPEANYDQRTLIMPLHTGKTQFGVNLALIKGLAKKGSVQLLCQKGELSPYIVVE